MLKFVKNEIKTLNDRVKRPWPEWTRQRRKRRMLHYSGIGILRDTRGVKIQR